LKGGGCNHLGGSSGAGLYLGGSLGGVGMSFPDIGTGGSFCFGSGGRGLVIGGSLNGGLGKRCSVPKWASHSFCFIGSFVAAAAAAASFAFCCPYCRRPSNSSSCSLLYTSLFSSQSCGTWLAGLFRSTKPSATCSSLGVPRRSAEVIVVGEED